MIFKKHLIKSMAVFFSAATLFATIVPQTFYAINFFEEKKDYLTFHKRNDLINGTNNSTSENDITLLYHRLMKTPVEKWVNFKSVIEENFLKLLQIAIQEDDSNICDYLYENFYNFDNQIIWDDVMLYSFDGKPVGLKVQEWVKIKFWTPTLERGK